MPSVSRIWSRSGEALTIEFGSLYPALKRVELKGWIAAKRETSEHNRPVRVYRLTAAGSRRLRQETTEWPRLCARCPARAKVAGSGNPVDVLEATRPPAT
jgi:DNA-binding PadR family transcriptional regulator